jgi:MFS family permease
MLTFGGFLLLAGRLGDLLGHRRLFLTGTALSRWRRSAPGSPPQTQLVAFRAVQGLAGGIASAPALSLIVTLFTEPVQRGEGDGRLRFRRRERRRRRPRR